MRRDFMWARVDSRVSFVFPARKLPRRSSFLSLGKFFDFAPVPFLLSPGFYSINSKVSVPCSRR